MCKIAITYQHASRAVFAYAHAFFGHDHALIRTTTVHYLKDYN